MAKSQPVGPAPSIISPVGIKAADNDPKAMESQAYGSVETSLSFDECGDEDTHYKERCDQ